MCGSIRFRQIYTDIRTHECMAYVAAMALEAVECVTKRKRLHVSETIYCRHVESFPHFSEATVIARGREVRGLKHVSKYTGVKNGLYEVG